MQSTIKVDLYRIVSDIVDQSTLSALNRCTKHVDWATWENDRDSLALLVSEEVLASLSEIIYFPSLYEEPREELC